MSESQCINCTRPTGDSALLCDRCRRTLEYAIANIAAYSSDLDTLRTRQVRYSTSSAGSRSAETPLPVDQRFTTDIGVGSELLWGAWNTLHAWCRIVAEENPALAGPMCQTQPCAHGSCARIWRTKHPRNTASSMCAYLLRWSDWLRHQAYADEILDELCDLESRLRRIVDRPADTWFAGACGAALEDAECQQQLYATVGKAAVTCPACGAEYDTQARRDYLLTYAEDQLATAVEAARAITVWSDYSSGEQRLMQRISMWVSRDRLEVRGHRGDRPTYRVGDILDLLAEDARRAEEKRSRPAKKSA